MEQIEEYLEDMFQSLENIPRTLSQVWIDITRYGPPIPSFPDVHLPGGLGDFEIPPPPPPPPPAHTTWIEQSTEWISNNPRRTAGIIAGSVLGAGLISYGAVYMRTLRARRLKEKTNERRQVVVVLGGDTPLALPLILDLEKKGYIVIASVSSADFGDNLERRCKGYVRALVLDPNEPSTVTVFLRSLSSALSRKFPITAAGDPFVASSAHPSAYLPYLNATHVVPLQVIQALLPMLRTGPNRGRNGPKKSIIVCVPATAARVGLPFSAMQSMSAVSTLRAAEVLRREVNIAALTDKSEAMKNIKVVVVDVGAFNFGPLDTFISPTEVYKAMEGWSSSEKLTYGPSFASLSHEVAELPSKLRWGSTFNESHSYGVPRKPTHVSVFVNNIVGTVSGGQFGPSIFGIGLGIGRLRNWLRGERFSVGAGASTYKFASFLPPLLLDTLINIPHFLISVRNALLPVQPFVRHPPPPPPVERAQQAPPAVRVEEDESGNDLSETGSEADVESNSGDGAGTWVNLKKEQHMEAV
ncbi:Protein kinase domain-containing protein [Mycena venus]|uniref:Protein kinase domain-containing protein n=1 Tax=Mycena venus TaxID=2733690 RepID=A0A8H7CJW0_9AGAR|nr:Protein kinase domain-containing protein [Mycena venus]